MPHDKVTGRWYDPPEARAVASLASAARTANGQSSAFETGEARALDVASVVTAISGAGAQLVLTLETSHDGTNWDAVGALPAQTANGTRKRTFAGLGPQCRYSWAITGTTPNITFRVDAFARR